VDDEERILGALQRTLRREGYRILTATSAEEALRLLEDAPVHAILTDQKMPGMSGLELLERAAARFPASARFLITGWPEEISPARMRKVGIRALIPKPWDSQALKQALREALASA
jgi:response regulator RpfG family c-di-GMP phosphodiesterase